jgi:hypothetical protein
MTQGYCQTARRILVHRPPRPWPQHNNAPICSARVGLDRKRRARSARPDSDEARKLRALGFIPANMRVVENYAGGKPSPLGDLPEEEFQMRRIMVSFLFAVCTSTLLWA